LTGELRAALRASQFLIVVCSPAAAKSTYVDEEIRYFHGLGRGDKILPVIVEGVSGDVAGNFPAALLELTPEAEDADATNREPLAADARKAGDGWKNAQLKLVGGLLGLPLGVIVQRQRERQIKERYYWSAAVATLAVMAAIAGLSTYHLLQTATRTRHFIDGSIGSTSHLVKKTARLADGLGLSASAAVEVLKGIEDLFKNYRGHDDTNPTVRVERTAMLLDFARHYSRLKQSKEQERAVGLALKELDGLKVHDDDNKRTIVRLKATAHWLRGEAYFADHEFRTALMEFEKGLKVIDQGDEHLYNEKVRFDAEQYVPRARLILGQARAKLRLENKEDPLKGKRDALEAAMQSVKIGRGLRLDTRRESDREGAELMVDARYLVADLIRQLNDRKQELTAEAHINDGLAGAQHLYQQDPKRASLVLKVATLHLARGDLRRWRGDSHNAYEDYKLSRDLRETVHKNDPGNLSHKFGFAFNLIKVGEELTTLRRPQDSIAEFELSERLLAELRKELPDDSTYRYWLWTAIQGQGHAHKLLGNLVKEAECHYRKLVLAQEHRLHAPDGVDSLYVLAESYRDYGNVLVSRGNVAGGLDHLAEAQKMLAPVVAKHSPDWRFLRMQASILESVARAKAIGRHFSDARDAVEDAYKLRVRDRIRTGKLDPHAQADMAENRRLVGSIQLANAQCQEAKSLYEEATAILDRLARDHIMPNPEWREKYEVARKELTEIAWRDGNPECSNEPVDRKMGEMIAMARQLLH
jgi:tetratricopeptide (TPR) repeat protein